MTKSDFTFIEKEPTGWWWFTVGGETRKEINSTIHEQGFSTVIEVGYNTQSREIIVLKQFICSKEYHLYENNKLLNLLKEICE